MSTRRRLPELGIRPLSARSVLLSALLGSHPPRLPVRALVAMGELYGFAAGTSRTALSRMVSAGDVLADDGAYELTDRMRERQALQDAGRRAPPPDWDGTWWFAIPQAEARSLGERRAFRAEMRHHRMGELRPDIWLRPANIAGPPATEAVLLTRGPLDGQDPTRLIARLWDLDRLADTARRLVAALDDASGWLEAGSPEALPDTFLVSVAVVRYLVTEPQLPADLVPEDWPADRLRAAYDRFETQHLALMRSFLRRTVADASASGRSTLDRSDHLL
jgi:phenylacetic acid degradation operon negative regulatory protein